MKRLSLALGAVAVALLPASAAFADTFNFSFSGTLAVSPIPVFGPTFSGSGTFTANQIGSSNEWNITGINGSVDGSAITGLLNVNTFQGNDNILLFPGDPGFNSPAYFTDGGVSFSLADSNKINLNDTVGFENAVAGTQYINFTELDCVDVTDPDPSPVPEPGTLSLLGTGILGAAGAIRRRAKS